MAAFSISKGRVKSQRAMITVCNGLVPLAEQIHEQVEPMCAAAGHRSKLPGSREVLESLIGRGKQLTGPTSGNSLTKKLLAMATADLIADLIRSALKSISIKNIRQWCANHLPRSLQSLRREELSPRKTGTIPAQTKIN